MGEVVGGDDQRNSFFHRLEIFRRGGQEDISHHVRGTCVGTLE